jgi:outer membrane lipoprotein SlyB
MMSHSAWIAMAFIYTAQTGLNYRRLRKGEIDKKEFWHRMRVNSVTTVGSMAVGSGGAAAGFAVGTLLFPGVGSIVGAVVGGIAGGFAGEKWGAQAYSAIEKKVQESKERRREEQRQKDYERLEAESRVSHLRYEEALHILGIHTYRATLG